MANRNGLGPFNEGPMTGRGLGPCGAGFRRGFSRGMGGGLGRGFRVPSGSGPKPQATLRRHQIGQF